MRYILIIIWAILLLISYLVFSYYTFDGWWYSSIGTGLTEPESFNMFLGSNEMLILSCVMAGLSFIYLIKKQIAKYQKMER